MEYTPLQPNQEATFGTSGDAVKALQTRLNATNMGRPGYKPLKVDGLYGPLTQSAAGFGSNIQNTGAYRQNTNANMNEFDDYFGANSVRARAEAISGDYATDIDRINYELSTYQKGLSKATGNLIGSIKDQFAIRKGQQEQVTRGQVAGVRASGYRTGANQVLQNYQSDLISEKERAGITKLAELDAQEAELVSQAEITKLDKDYKAFNDAMDSLRGIRKEKSSTVSGIYKDALDYNKSLQDMELDRKKYELDVQRENRLGSESKDDADPVKAQNKYIISTRARRKLNRNGLDDTVLKDITDYLIANNGDLNKLFAEYNFSTAQKRAITNNVK